MVNQRPQSRTLLEWLETVECGERGRYWIWEASTASTASILLRQNWCGSVLWLCLVKHVSDLNHKLRHQFLWTETTKACLSTMPWSPRSKGFGLLPLTPLMTPFSALFHIYPWRETDYATRNIHFGMMLFQISYSKNCKSANSKALCLWNSSINSGYSIMDTWAEITFHPSGVPYGRQFKGNNKMKSISYDYLFRL